MQHMVQNTSWFVGDLMDTAATQHENTCKALPEVSSMFPHVNIQIVLPFGDVSTFSTHEVLVV